VGPIIVIFDAMDECEVKHKKSISRKRFRLISKAVNRKFELPQIKFLATSRPLLGRRYTANLLEIEGVHKDIEGDLRLVI
jgi:ankyrin repeat domain-containing protein 50